MKSTPVPLSFIIVTIMLNACSEKSLTGNWKLRRVDLIDIPNQKKRFTIDLTKPEKIEADLYKDKLKDVQLLQTDTLGLNNLIDTTINLDAIKAEINQYVSSLIKTNVTFGYNNKFQMKSNGLIIPSAVPGWHFGDTIEGIWTKNNDTLNLSVGDGKQGYKWKFKILQLTKSVLKLQEFFDGFSGSGNELQFVREQSSQASY